MKTILTSFQFDTRNKDEREACEALRARLTSTPGRGHCMGPVWGDRAPGHMCGKEFANGTPVTLSTVHFFGNQWNTDDEHNARVFDWVEYCWHNNRHLVTGHYLDITPEMRAIRDNTNACGYCAHREPAAKGSVFCPQCLGSEYLMESDLRPAFRCRTRAPGPALSRCAARQRRRTRTHRAGQVSRQPGRAMRRCHPESAHGSGRFRMAI
jgi:hypothetical protein